MERRSLNWLLKPVEDVVLNCYVADVVMHADAVTAAPAIILSGAGIVHGRGAVGKAGRSKYVPQDVHIAGCGGSGSPVHPYLGRLIILVALAVPRSIRTMQPVILDCDVGCARIDLQKAATIRWQLPFHSRY